MPARGPLVAQPEKFQTPGALGNAVCVWRQMAERALRAVNRSTRALFLSNNYSAIAPVVRAGLAVTILPVACVPSDLRILGAESGIVVIEGHQSTVDIATLQV